MDSNFPELKTCVLSLSSVQSLSHVWLFVTPRTTACQASLSITKFLWPLCWVFQIFSASGSKQISKQRNIYLNISYSECSKLHNPTKRYLYPNPWKMWMWPYLQKSSLQCNLKLKTSRWNIQWCTYKRKVWTIDMGEKAIWRATWRPRLNLCCQMPRNARVIATTAETLTESIIIKNTSLMDKGGKLIFFSKGSMFYWYF